MKDMKNLNWLKDERASSESDFRNVSNPLASFESQSSDLSKWLKPVVLETSFIQDNNPLSSVLDKYSNMTIDQWLLSDRSDDIDTKVDFCHLDREEGKWLVPPSRFSPFMENEDFDCGDML